MKKNVLMVLGVLVLFVFMLGCAEQAEENVEVVDEEGNLVGEAYRIAVKKTRTKPLPAYDESKLDCYDTDGGLIYSQKGKLLDSQVSKRLINEDKCEDSTHLLEAYCRNTKGSYVPAYKSYTCQYGCLNGACLGGFGGIGIISEEDESSKSVIELTSCHDSSWEGWQEGKNYVLTSSISDLSDDCFDIGANDITLDCQGNHIEAGLWSGGSHKCGYVYKCNGINLNSKTGITIKNCIISNFFKGISLEDSNYNALISNTIKNSKLDGIRLDFSSSNNVLNLNILDNNFDGILLTDSSNNNILISNKVSHSSQIGIWLLESSNNELLNNIASDNGNSDDYATGIDIHESHNNVLTGNIANGNSHGILIFSSKYNTLTSNTANNNEFVGFDIGYSKSNILNQNIGCNNNNNNHFDLKGNIVGDFYCDNSNVLSGSDNVFGSVSLCPGTNWPTSEDYSLCE